MAVPERPWVAEELGPGPTLPAAHAPRRRLKAAFDPRGILKSRQEPPMRLFSGPAGCVPLPK
ncbi:hypothetical protein ACIBVL_21420 [Streptomyces sp. NPDC049687]|uniref:hypothetical protein n=1 Tax=Streptomyces sp. NPDC049687 TaxID=3365596 RepID=UPI00378F9585